MNYEEAVDAYNLAKTDVDRYKYASFAYTAAVRNADATWPGSAGRDWHASAGVWQERMAKLAELLGVQTLADHWAVVPEAKPATYADREFPLPTPPQLLPAGQREAWLEVKRLGSLCAVAREAVAKAERRERYTYNNVPAASQERYDAELALAEANEALGGPLKAYLTAMDAYVTQYGYPGEHQDLIRQWEG